MSISTKINIISLDLCSDDGDSGHYTAGDNEGYSEQSEGGDSNSYDNGETYSHGHSGQYQQGDDGGDYRSGNAIYTFFSYVILAADTDMKVLTSCRYIYCYF